ncbi:MAG: hypothetical protein AAGJ28_22330, partial [Pseudomonadota bacterium]
SERTLITDVHLFDDVNDARIENANVLFEDKLLARVTTDPLDTDGATVSDGDGRTLMPGLIDVHWHTTYAYTPAAVLMMNQGDMAEVAIRSMTGPRKPFCAGSPLSETPAATRLRSRS